MAPHVTSGPLLQPLSLTPAHTLQPAGPSILFLFIYFHSVCLLSICFHNAEMLMPKAPGLGSEAAPSADLGVWDRALEALGSGGLGGLPGAFIPAQQVFVGNLSAGLPENWLKRTMKSQAPPQGTFGLQTR